MSIQSQECDNCFHSFDVFELLILLILLIDKGLFVLEYTFFLRQCSDLFIAVNSLPCRQFR